jgi:iodotyrosine deiodinase
MRGKHPFVPLDFERLPEEEMRRRAREFFETMNRRRTVRQFTDRPVPREIVEQAIRTAGTAPSGAHKQPWHFALIGDSKIKREIRTAAETEERESYEHRMPNEWLEDLEPLGTDWHKPFLTTCPWLIVVFSQPFGRVEGNPDTKKKHYYVQESVGISVGMLLAALHVAGLATLTHTPSPMGFLQRILDRPDHERAYMLIALGYPASGCEVPDLTRKSLGDILTTY